MGNKYLFIVSIGFHCANCALSFNISFLVDWFLLPKMSRSNFSKFLCQEDNSIKAPKFDVVEEEKVIENRSQECLEILSRDDLVEGPNSVHRHSVSWRCYLAVDEFRGTLKQWIIFHEKDSFFCVLQKDVLGEKRPSENLRRVLEGMFFSVCTMHMQGQFHGSLLYPENYALAPIADFPGCGGPHYVSVTLLKVRGDFSRNSSLNLSKDQLEEMIFKDIQDLHHLVFNTILGINKVEELPEDLMNLHKIMSSDPSIQTSTFDLPLNELYAHPGLWHWNKRTLYYADGWDAYCSFEKCIRNVVGRQLNAMIGVGGWVGEITKDKGKDKDSTLLDVYEKEGVSYQNDGPSLLRFAKAVTLHAKKARDDVTGLRIEKMIREKFPHLMVESHGILAMNNRLL